MTYYTMPGMTGYELLKKIKVRMNSSCCVFCLFLEIRYECIDEKGILMIMSSENILTWIDIWDLDRIGLYPLRMSYDRIGVFYSKEIW
jgi:hypothetical protein